MVMRKLNKWNLSKNLKYQVLEKKDVDKADIAKCNIDAQRKYFNQVINGSCHHEIESVATYNIVISLGRILSWSLLLIPN